MRKLGLLTSLLVLVALQAGSANRITRADSVLSVIAHKSVAVRALSRDDLRPIFETRKTTWPDGSPVRPFNLDPSTRGRRVFDSVVLGLTPEVMPRFWIDRRVRGDSRPPRTIPSDASMLKVVRSLPGAVGYVEGLVTDSTVKVIARIVGGRVMSP
jgi:hypothetical protein